MTREKYLSVSRRQFYGLTLGFSSVLAGCTTAPLGNEPTAGNTYFRDTPPPFPEFSASDENSKYRFDFPIWQRVLEAVVVDFGEPDRINLSNVLPATGTKLVPGHRSRYRLDGNRILFSFDTKEMAKIFSFVREDLEEIGNKAPLEKMSRSSQTAFWMNLHNAIVADEIAKRYPIQKPERLTDGDGRQLLYDSKLTTIKGRALSLKDIRIEIVYRNWRNPLAIYGFWRGVVGGPGIRQSAFTGANLLPLLNESAKEFINSLRGVMLWDDHISISKVYNEARPLFPGWPQSLRDHFLAYATPILRNDLETGRPFRADAYDTVVADLAGGTRQEQSRKVASFGGPSVDARLLRLPETARRIMVERQKKFERLRIRELRELRLKRRDGSVTIKDVE